MTQKKFYLLTDPSIICSYLVSKWIEAFEKMPEFQGILVKEEVQSNKVITERKNFHQKYFGQKNLTDEIYELLIDLYPGIEKLENITLLFWRYDNVSDMVRNRKLAKAISDLGWRQFRTLTEAKCETHILHQKKLI
uniref:hypothetical protein n=1 Tax=Okeania sp. SIO2F4 TaxID=2607790 RepID=UPI0025E3ADD7|nr:hypothetical protein [Okeania sp. SIO2F4]